MSDSRLRALLLAAVLVWWSGLVAPRLPSRWRVPLHAVLAGALVAATDAPLGLRHPHLWRGLRTGVVAAGAACVAVASSTAVPSVRTGMRRRVLPSHVASWTLVQIPIGTVWSEEAAFRGALAAVAVRAFGPRLGRIVAATSFGLSHVADARGAGEPVGLVVLATGAAGWAFGWLHDRSGSLAAPMLAHLAINEAGAVAAVAASRGVTD
jgi:membrane protease YdiL (CAAX protease family)